MSWQDEQRRLDEELSAGQISSEGYQRRRYELMYRYGGDESNTAGDQPEPESGDQSATPFPPAFRWETRPDEGNETTQLFTPVDADETQVVRPQQNDTDRTQVVHGGSPAQQGRQGWGALDSTPSWASSEVPSTQQPDSDWTSQRQGSFEPERSSRAPLIAVVTLVVVLLLVGGGFGTYWLLGRDGTPQAGQQQPPAAPAQQPGADQPQLPAPPAPRPGSNLPDPAEIGGDGQRRVLSTLSELQAAGVLTPQEYDAMARAGATASKLVVSSFADGPTASILITRVRSGETAATARDELAELQRQAGFRSAGAPDPGLKSSVQVGDPVTVRGYYRSGDLLVRMEVIGPEPVATASRYDDTIVRQQLATLPADD